MVVRGNSKKSEEILKSDSEISKFKLILRFRYVTLLNKYQVTVVYLLET